MAPNQINVNSQMQQLADNAVAVARDKFGFSLDFTENSLQQLDMLLQQAHERYKQGSSSGNPSNIPIENTVRVWGSYLGEVFRRSLGGDWIVDQKNVFLQLGPRRLDPLGQVRSRIVDGPLYNIQSFFQGLKSGIQNNLKEQSIKPIESMPGYAQPFPPPPPPQRSRKGLWIGLAIGAVVLCLCCIIVVGVYFFGQNIPYISSFFPSPTLP